MIAGSLLEELDPVYCTALYASFARNSHVPDMLEAMLVLAQESKLRRTPA
jgi:hypothetical protein